MPIYSDSALSEEAEVLARKIVGSSASAGIQEFARRIAEAHIDLRRVRYARHELLSQALSNPYYESRANMREKAAVLRSLLRANAQVVPWSGLVKYLTSTPEGPRKFVTILAQANKQLLAIDRYERRARSRRDLAIRALDEARLRYSNSHE